MTNESTHPSKFDVGYWSSYFWDHYKKVKTTFFPIPENVAIKLSNPYLPEEMRQRTIARVHKAFVVIHSTDDLTVLIENHDGNFSLILIERKERFSPGIWHKVLDIPAEIAQYWLNTPTKRLLSEERQRTFNKLEDERSFWFNLFHLKQGLRKVAKADSSYGVLALHRKGKEYSLYTRLR